jgi:type I restriction enzyme, S subunit
MSKEYICELCKKVFNQKIDFTRHQNKKSPCISLTEIQEITQIKEVKKDIKSTLINVFKNCLNVLRDNEGLTGEKALRNLSYLLTLKLLEPRFGNEIDIDNYEYNFSSYFEDELIEANKKKLLNIVRFSNLSNEKDDDIPNLMKYLWDIILSIHPSTKNIFLKDKKFDIQRKTTYKKLIDKLNSLDLSKTEYDVLGNAYEEVIQDIMTGKVLGQFFTQPSIKKMMVKLINPQIHIDGKIDTCGDPTMGTGGFLITYLQEILKQAKIKNIKPDWEFIKTEGLYGKELEPDTYQLAVSNMLISSGHMFENLDRGDSIRDPIIRKFDNILANPPFGIKGLKYDELESSLKNEYLPIKTDNAVSLFIQAIIYMLKINGKCAIVLPDGQDLFSKSNNTLVAIREFLMKTCDLKEIIYLPSGIFTYTTIKTCVFYFIKKKEGTEVLETKIKISKTQKETGRDYKFTKTHQTSNVKFYDFNPYEDIKNLLVEVAIEKIANNSYSLNYTEYMKDETKEKEYNDEIDIKLLGEVCIFLSKSKRQASYGNKDGKYQFYTSSQYCSKYCDEYDYEDECLIVGTGGNANIKYSSHFSCSTDNFILKINTGQLIKYIYYYILLNIEILEKGFIGVGIKHISQEYLKNIKIPIPSIERQKEIVKYLDFIYEKSIKTSNEKIAELKTLNEYCLNNQKLYGVNSIKKLSEVCEKIVSGKFNSKDCKLIGKYPFYTNKAINPDGFSDNYCFDYDKYFILIKDGGAGNNKYGDHIGLGKIFKVFGKSGGTSHQYALIPKKDFNFEYLYYYLKFIKNTIMDLAHYTTGLGCIKKSDVENLEIPVPSLERQKEIVEYCEHNDMLIKQLEKEIENNKAIAQQFITSIVKLQIIIEENSEELQEQKKILSVDNDSNKDSDNDDKSSVSSVSSVKELKQQCKSLGIKGYSKLNKDELIEMINKSQ